MTSLSRRELLLGGSALLLLAGCGGPSIPTPTASPTGSIRSQLDEALRTISGGSQAFGVAIHDLRSGVDYGFNPGYNSQSASIAKPMIVLMAQRQARATGGGALTPEQVELATKAITESDNDSADALWEFGGRSNAYTELAGELAMPETHHDPARDFWSWTWTTPSDQVLLLTRLTEGSPAITAEEGAFVWQLMGEVEDAQAWGVGAPRSESVTAHLKNGWVEFESTDGLWAVNSIGQVTGDSRDYRMAIMTRTPDFDTGRETCNAVGQWVFDILGSGPIEAA